MKNNFLTPSKVSADQRTQQLQQEPRLIWFTGLSGSGKSTLALRLEHHLFHLGYKVYLLDGDNVRNGLNCDLGFSQQDREENIRRVSEVAKLMMDAGLVVICAFISPYRDVRQKVRATVGADKFTEVFVNCPLKTCEHRDTKGLYKKARKGEISDFTGISAPYESPDSPCIEIHTDLELVDESVYRLINYIEPMLEAKNKPAAFVSEHSVVSEPFSFIL